MTGVTRLAWFLGLAIATFGLASFLFYVFPPLFFWPGLTLNSCWVLGQLLIPAFVSGVGFDRVGPWHRRVSFALFHLVLGGLTDYTMHRVLGLRDFSTFLLLAIGLPLVCVASLLFVFAPPVRVETDGVIQLFPASEESASDPPDAGDVRHTR